MGHRAPARDAALPTGSVLRRFSAGLDPAQRRRLQMPRIICARAPGLSHEIPGLKLGSEGRPVERLPPEPF